MDCFDAGAAGLAPGTVLCIFEFLLLRVRSSRPRSGVNGGLGCSLPWPCVLALARRDALIPESLTQGISSATSIASCVGCDLREDGASGDEHLSHQSLYQR